MGLLSASIHHIMTRHAAKRRRRKVEHAMRFTVIENFSEAHDRKGRLTSVYNLMKKKYSQSDRLGKADVKLGSRRSIHADSALSRAASAKGRRASYLLAKHGDRRTEHPYVDVGRLRAKQTAAKGLTRIDLEDAKKYRSRDRKKTEAKVDKAVHPSLRKDMRTQRRKMMRDKDSVAGMTSARQYLASLKKRKTQSGGYSKATDHNKQVARLVHKAWHKLGKETKRNIP